MRIVTAQLCLRDVLTCEEARLERRQLRNAAGVVLHCLQCMTCGRHTCHRVKRDGSNPPELDRELSREAEELRRQYWEGRDDLSARRLDYQNYRQTAEWAVLRERVKQRDKICQGCLAAPIENVHHRTYEHVKNEFAFELIGLCRKCHARLHAVPE
jgi:hypothetical protein